MNDAARPGRGGRAAALLVILIAVGYGSSLRNDFVHDDVLFMTLDPRVQSVERLPLLFVESRWAFRDREGRNSVDQYYRPLEPLPYALSHLVFDRAAWPGHLLNLLLHLANSLLVLAALRRVLENEQAALLGAVLFAVQPAYSEAVVWIAAAGGLGAVGCVMAIYLLHSSPHGGRWYGGPLTALLYLGALCFKETGLLAPVFVALHDLVLAPDRGGRRVWRLRWRYAVFVPPLLLYMALRLHALGEPVPGLDYVPLTNGEVVLNAVALLPQYVRTFLWPFSLNFHHDFDAIHGIGSWSFWMGSGTLLAAAVGFAGTARRRRRLAFGIAWTLIAVAPYLLVHVPHGNVFAERYLYDPAFGACVLLGYGWLALGRRLPLWGRRLAGAAAAALVVFFVGVDARRTLDWRDEVTLFSKTIEQSERAEILRVNLAVRFLHLGRYDEGIAVLRELVKIDPTYRGAWHNLGLLYQAKGMSDAALDAFVKARSSDPFNEATLLNLGYLYDQHGQREEALEAYFRLIELAPRHADGWYNLAVVAFESGQLANARMAAQQVLEVRPDDEAARQLLRRIEAAAEQRRDRGPTANPATVRRCQAAKQAVDERRYDDAVVALRAAAWLDESAALPHHYLANVYYLMGRLAAAAQHEREAVERAPGNDLYRRNLSALEEALGVM